MKIGIYLTTATCHIFSLENPGNNELSSKSQPFFYSLPCAFYADADFVYVGEEVKQLQEATGHLEILENFLDTLTNLETIIYTDPSGYQWNKLSVLAMMLTQINNLIQKKFSTTISSVFWTTALLFKEKDLTTLKSTFRLSGLPSVEFLDLYQLLNTIAPKETQKQLICLQNKLSTTIRLLPKEELKNNESAETYLKLGTIMLYEDLANHIQFRFEKITNTEIEVRDQYKKYFLDLSEELVLKYLAKKQFVYPVVINIEATLSEFYVTEKEIDLILSRFATQMVEQSEAFIKKEVPDPFNYTLWYIGHQPISTFIFKSISINNTDSKIISKKWIPEKTTLSLIFNAFKIYILQNSDKQKQTDQNDYLNTFSNGIDFQSNISTEKFRSKILEEPLLSNIASILQRVKLNYSTEKIN